MALSGNQKSGSSLPPAAIAAAIAALVALVGIIGYRTLSPAPAIVQTEPTAQSKETSAFIALKAKESGGDINKLTPEDRKKLQTLTAGHGEQSLSGAARKQ